MNYAQLRKFDVANGEGIRTTIFVSGCEFYCKDCFNRDYWDFNYGNPFTMDTISTILNNLNNDRVRGLSILGGEPLHPKNSLEVSVLIDKVRTVYGQAKDIWIWTGYTFEELLESRNYYILDILSNVDVIVDGQFIADQKDMTLKFRGSKNQRLINVKESLRQNKVVLYQN